MSYNRLDSTSFKMGHGLTLRAWLVPAGCCWQALLTMRMTGTIGVMSHVDVSHNAQVADQHVDVMQIQRLHGGCTILRHTEHVDGWHEQEPRPNSMHLQQIYVHTPAPQR